METPRPNPDVLGGLLSTTHGYTGFGRHRRSSAIFDRSSTRAGLRRISSRSRVSLTSLARGKERGMSSNTERARRGVPAHPPRPAVPVTAPPAREPNRPVVATAERPAEDHLIRGYN